MCSASHIPESLPSIGPIIPCPCAPSYLSREGRADPTAPSHSTPAPKFPTISPTPLAAGVEDEVTVRVKPKQLAVICSIMAEELLALFVCDTHRLRAHVNESYRMADGLTLDTYLALSDAERDALWQQAMQEAHDAGEREPERDIPAHYMPAGQKRRSRRVRGKN